MTDSEYSIKEKYGLFDGRRQADEYVKGYLKAVMWISGVGLSIFMTFGGWVTLQITSQATKTSIHESRLATIEANRFIAESNFISDKINANEVKLAKLESAMNSIDRDLDEIKVLLRRAAPHEARN